MNTFYDQMFIRKEKKDKIITTYENHIATFFLDIFNKEFAYFYHKIIIFLYVEKIWIGVLLHPAKWRIIKILMSHVFMSLFFLNTATEFWTVKLTTKGRNSSQNFAK